MKKNTFLIIGLLALLAQPGITQNSYKGEISVDVSTYTKQDNKIIVNANIILDKLRLTGNEMITITPIIRSLGGAEQIALEPLIVNGATRDKINRRAVAFGDYSYPENAAGIIKRNNSTLQLFSYSLETDYHQWMRNSELVFIESVTGCNCDDKGNASYSGGKLELPPVYTPQFQVSYLVPEVEAVKHRADSYSASLNYAVNKSTIDRSFKNNAIVLDKVDQIISEINQDPNVEINKIVVTGYSSPDGSENYNLQLSEIRANSFTDYLINRHSFPKSILTTNWQGEDWQGLETVIKESDYPYKNDVLQIINNTSDTNKRKTALKNLQDGEVYRSLLETYFPLLRRNSYHLFYTVRGLDAEQAKELISVRPQQLSLNEMFMVANSYEKGSQKFKDTFTMAVKLYPDNVAARFNSFASDIETGSYDDAVIGLLETDQPEGWNNLGVGLFYKGDYDHALHYFEKASQAGLKEAGHNLSQYNQWFENKDN